MCPFPAMSGSFETEEVCVILKIKLERAIRQSVPTLLQENEN